MKNAIVFLAYSIAFLFLTASCSKEEPPNLTIDLPEVESEITLKGDTLYDHRDGQNYPVFEVNGKIWMAQNLNLEVPDSWYYDNEPNHVIPYGRLYTWDAAMKACPEGWRLPTETEMEELIEYEGGYAKAFRTMLAGGSSDFNALLGGWYNPQQEEFHRQGVFGMYWTSTEVDVEEAQRYKFYSDIWVVLPANMPKYMAYSCRCLTEG